MYNDNDPRNPWVDYPDEESNLSYLRKSIREQHILLDAALSNQDDHSIEELKKKITLVSQELNEKQQLQANRGYSTQTPSQWWSRYQLNLRQLEDLADQRQTLLKEINYLIDTGVKTLQEELYQETETLNQIKKKQKQVNLHLKKSLSTSTNDYEGLSDSERVKAKAQAMLAARLKKSGVSATELSQDNDILTKLSQIDQIADYIKHCKSDLDLIVTYDLNAIDDDLASGEIQLKERQMFEQGLYVDDEIARFIDQLGKKPLPAPSSSLFSSSPASSSFLSSSPVSSYLSSSPSSSYSLIPPTAQRPATPRSAESIKAEAYRRIEERKHKFITKEIPPKRSATPVVTEEEKAAQERMRQAEAEARARLEQMREKRNKQRQDTAEAEERKKKAAIEAAEAEAAAAIEAEEKKKRDEEERLAKIERAKKEKERAAELEKLRLEKEVQNREDRLALELHQRRAKQAAEQAAREKRMRRLELEKQERELEAARQQEIQRRLQWEESERQKQLEEQAQIQKKEQEALELRKRLEEEQSQMEEKKRMEEERQRRLEEERQRRLETERQKRLEAERQKRLEEERKRRLEEEKRAREKEEETLRLRRKLEEQARLEEKKRLEEARLEEQRRWEEEARSEEQKRWEEEQAQEFRVRTLYEFKKTRDDDLGFLENEIILVHPLQDDHGDWWYGTNEYTQETGYFPKTYVEKIEPINNSYQPTSSAPIPIPYNSKQLSVDDTPHKLSSAPNTPILKKTNLNMSKQELTKRRRAVSNVSNTSRISTPKLIIPHTDEGSENLELLTWASTMDPIELDAIPAEERKRQEAIFELIATERSYLKDLQMIINIFYVDCGKYLSQDERDVVFSNIDDLLMCNTALLSDMESRQREKGNVVDNIGDVFLTHANSLNCYSSYCRNQSYATKFLQKKRENDHWFEVFLKTAQTWPECRSLDLSHFLLEPVQRITRYPLLLRQILNCTPRYHQDYSLVKSALSVAQRVLADVNEETRRFENNQKMIEFSRIIDMEASGRLNISGREYVMDGLLFKAKSGRKLHGFLFNDILLLTEPLKQLSPEGYLYTLYRDPMPIERVSVRQQQSNNLMQSFSNNTAEDLSFQIVSGNQVIAVRTATITQKRQWMSQIQHYSAYLQS